MKPYSTDLARKSAFFHRTAAILKLTPQIDDTTREIETILPGGTRLHLFFHPHTENLSDLSFYCYRNNHHDLFPATATTRFETCLSRWQTAFRVAIGKGEIKDLRDIAILTTILANDPENTPP